ncbi:MAG: DUF29 domain-containing protein [Thermosynechococcaceae cyanobacterium]
MTGTQAAHQKMYDTDFVQWADEAADLLKQGEFSKLDLEHLIEEVEELGNSERKALRSQLTRLGSWIK